ncbi:MAG TPA: 3'-5' exonuclease, partial [Paludibacter sp.]|nr:3'-5' exonuclease [Paludibacter sp.]
LPRLLEDLQERGYRPADICILVRDKKDAHGIIGHLLTYKTSGNAKPGTCYDILGNEGLLIGGAPSVRFVLGLLQLFLNPEDTIQRTIVNYEYARGRLGKPENEALNFCFLDSVPESSPYSMLFTKYENEKLNHLQHGSLYNTVEQIIALFDIGSWPNEAVFIQAFQDLVFRYSTGKTADLNSFLAWWKLTGAKQFIATPDNQNAMRIMTIHKSKGLDFRVVVMPFCEWELDMKKGNLKNFLWCEPRKEPFNELPLLPVQYDSSLERSIFAEDYFDEKMHRYIDNLNLGYVAFTRAKNELICMMPDKHVEEDTKMNSFSMLLKSCINAPASGSDAETISLRDFYRAENGIFELGEPGHCIYQDKPEDEISVKVTGYPCVSSSERLRVRHKSLEYLIEGQQLTDSRLNYGIIMHDILRQIIRKSDQPKVLQEMIRTGRINESEGCLVEAELQSFWDLPETAAWFAADARVLAETSILMPSGAVYRPDRVVIRGNEATVVDYKFGEIEKSMHSLQVRQYMDLIGQMGYQVQGYLCYVSLKKVEEVR